MKSQSVISLLMSILACFHLVISFTITSPSLFVRNRLGREINLSPHCYIVSINHKSIIKNIKNKSIEHGSPLAAIQNEDDEEIEQSKDEKKANINDDDDDNDNNSNNSNNDINYRVSKNQRINDPATTSFAAVTAELINRPHELDEQEINDVLLSLSKVSLQRIIIPVVFFFFMADLIMHCKYRLVFIILLYSRKLQST